MKYSPSWHGTDVGPLNTSQQWFFIEGLQVSYKGTLEDVRTGFTEEVLEKKPL
jgi:hypothetical protein